MGGTKGGGSTGSMNAGIQNTGPQNTGSQGGGGLNSLMKSHPQLFNLFSMIASPRMKGDVDNNQTGFAGFRTARGNNGAMQPQGAGRSAMPFDAMMQFFSSKYASGGSVDDDVDASLEEDIKAAIRLARMIGRMTEKL
jgi:hypothetical protein